MITKEKCPVCNSNIEVITKCISFSADTWEINVKCPGCNIPFDDKAKGTRQREFKKWWLIRALKAHCLAEANNMGAVTSAQARLPIMETNSLPSEPCLVKAATATDLQQCLLEGPENEKPISKNLTESGWVVENTKTIGAKCGVDTYLFAKCTKVFNLKDALSCAKAVFGEDIRRADFYPGHGYSSAKKNPLHLPKMPAVVFTVPGTPTHKEYSKTKNYRGYFGLVYSGFDFAHSPGERARVESLGFNAEITPVVSGKQITNQEIEDFCKELQRERAFFEERLGILCEFGFISDEKKGTKATRLAALLFKSKKFVSICRDIITSKSLSVEEIRKQLEALMDDTLSREKKSIGNF